MTGTELLTELVDERTRLLAEVERLRARVTELEAPVRKRDYGATDADGIPLNDGNAISMLHDTLAENERLQRRCDLLELNVQTLATEPRLLAAGARIEELEATVAIAAREADRQISQQQVRIIDLEAKVAILCGSLAKRAVMPEDDQPAIIHHDVKPNAPR